MVTKYTKQSQQEYIMINLFLCFALLLSSPVKSTSDHTALVYQNCGTQIFPADYSDTLLSLFQELVAHSSQSNFFTTLAGDADAPITGLFQCRGDLSSNDCHNCVSALPQMSSSLCGQSAAARIQLQGCYLRYELEGAFDRTPDRTCGEGEGEGGFEEAREAAFAAAESGVVAGDGFYSGGYGGVEVVAQCDGDLRGCDCGECVDGAMEIARRHCGFSVQANIYLDRCFFTYTYLSHKTSNEKGRDDNNNSGKTAAIVVGGAAALCFGFIFLLFIKSLAKKGDDY